MQHNEYITHRSIIQGENDAKTTNRNVDVPKWWWY